ncbi:TonB-dependent receptor [Azorhizobium oxalatiphilum]|uniref:TonB-dependent receptor n=1 Tax=Azorhizobium oxalatiphilum TaxID=980631 RepID=A0A917C9K3_9HYPH|nr:TonB-dependent siderophore receptor [Azorhizobium oxalatiphilum]GGF78376.1 TonB-dependent receptor [Azorhizobium oxalatiphilum]
MGYGFKANAGRGWGTAGRGALVAALLATTGIAGTVMLPGAARAQAQASFNIPAGSLAQALAAFGRQSGTQLSYEAAIVSGKSSPGVQGVVPREQALARILQGSGLTYSFTDSRNVLIRRPVAAGGADAAGAIALDTVDVQGAGGTVGYVATRAVASTKTDTPLVEVPQSVTVVSREELDDRNVQTLTQAVAYTPGVRTGQSGYDPRFDVFTIRGFDTTYNGIYRDGLRLPGSNMSVFKIEPYGVDSVTVLRGPSSALYGLGSPGGLVDVTSKRPTETAFGEVELQAGNYDLWQGQFDVGGPVDKDGKLLYRLTGAVRDAGSPNVLGGGVNDMTYIAPAITYKPNDSTRITILGEYMDYETPASLPFYGWTGGSTDTFSRTPGDYNSQKQTQYLIGYLAEHDVNDIFTVRQKVRYGHADTQVRYTGMNSLDEATNTASRYSAYVHDKMDSFAIDNQVQAKFTTGAVEHTLLVGVDYTYLTLDDGIGYGTASDYNYTYNIAYGPIVDPDFNTSRYKQKQSQLGLYVQEQAKFGGFLLTLTGRQDFVKTTNDDLLAYSSETQKDDAFTGRVGLTYLFDNGIAPYVSYSTSFAPNLGQDINGNTFSPTTAKQIEGGVKYAPTGFDGYIAASVFQINQENGLVTDESNPLYQVQTGEVRARGFELEGVANLGQGLKVRGAYAYLDLTNVAGTSDTLGLTPSGQPQNTFSFWADYQFQPGTVLAGLGIGAGVRYTGATWGNSLNTFQNSAYTLVDAKLSYDLVNMGQQFKGWSMQVNAQNLLDDEYITCDAGYCYKGMPRTVIAGVKYRW